jgi:hypothetical protein
MSGTFASHRSYLVKGPEEDLLLQLAKVLLRAGADITRRSVIEAMLNRHEELACDLLDEGADPDWILEAALSNVTGFGPDKCLRIIKRSVQAGASVQTRSKWRGQTLLDKAANCGLADISEFLCQYGARPTGDTLKWATSG